VTTLGGPLAPFHWPPGCDRLRRTQTSIGAGPRISELARRAGRRPSPPGPFQGHFRAL